MAIELRHEVLFGQVRFEYVRLCDLVSQVRQIKAERELDLTQDRYIGYAMEDDAIVMDIGALISREERYYEAETLFDYTFEQVHSDRITDLRRDIDKQLLEVLRTAGWSEERLQSLQGVLEDRLQMDVSRRDEMIAYAKNLNEQEKIILTHRSRGHFGEMCNLMASVLEDLREDCATLAAKVREPVTGT